MQKTKLTLLLLSVIAPMTYAEESAVLDEISVTAEGLKPKDEVFLKSGAVSVREVKNSTQNLDAIVRSVPGAFTQADKSQGVIAPNIRGTSGLGRVNTLIDGVTQTFYATSTDDGGRGSGTSQFGALIDPNFLVALDIERGAFKGKQGANSLMGAVNFKTLGVNDVVSQGNQIGGVAKFLTGTNAIGPHYMGAVAAKKPFSDDRWVGLLYGYSWRKISQDYKVGGGARITDNTFDLIDIDEYDYAESYATQPFKPEHLKQKPTSQLAKLEYGDRYNQTTLSYRDFHNMVAGRKINSKTYQLDYHFALPDNPWLNFNLLYSHNKADQKYATGQKFSGLELKSPLVARNTSNTLDISNTFAKELNADFYVNSTLGMNLLMNRYGKNRHPVELNVNLAGDHSRCFGLDCIFKSVTNSSFQPNGKQNLTTFYWDNSLNYKLFTLDLNMNMVKHKFKGEYSEYIPYYIDDLGEEIAILRKNKNEAMARELASKQEALQKQYCKYDDGYDEDGEFYEYLVGYYDCRDVNIFLDRAGKHRKINYSATLSANLHELFTPFVSYAKTHRMPNIKEMFLSNFGKYGINLDLRPEQAKTLQIGFNGFKEGIFTENDKLGFKFTFYKTKIKDYVYNVLYTSPPASHYKYLNVAVIQHQNSPKLVTNKGVELELNYDMKRFYSNLALAYQKSNAPTSFTDYNPRVDTDIFFYRNELGYGASKMTILPRIYASLDLGTRWLDEKLVIGTTVKYFGKSQRASHKTDNIYHKSEYSTTQEGTVIGFTRQATELPKQPMVVDFHLSYEPIKNLVLKAEVQNVFDKKYIDPLDSNNDSAAQHIDYIDDNGLQEIDVLTNFARGRTFVFGASYKF